MEDICSIPDINDFPIKSKVCVVCASLITEECVFVPEEGSNSIDGFSPLQFQQQKAPICSDIFLNGLSVLCEVLKIDSGFTDSERWTIAGGREDFVGNVCCRECYSLFGKLVTLHELIVATQASLREDARAIQEFIFQSQDKDVEYSINTCLEFREDVLKKARHCIVSTLPLAPEVPGTDDDDFEDHYSSKEFFHCKNVAQTDSRKRGRPRKHVEIITPVRGKRGRPRKHVQSSDSEICTPVIKLKRGRPIKDEGYDRSSHEIQKENFESKKDPLWSPNENESTVKRKRGRPKKETPESETSIPLVKQKRGRPRNDERQHNRDEEANSDFHTTESKITTKNNQRSAKSILKRVHATNRRQFKCIKSNEMKDNAKRTPGRPRKYDRSILPNGPRQHPVYVLKGLCEFLMYLNVKFQKETSAFRCQHPDCSHLVPITGYFTDQTAYKSMRLHIRNFHRNKYQLVGQERKKYYYCCYCEIQLNCLNKLLVHKRNEHPEEIPLAVVCEICGDVMHHQMLTKHLISHKNEDERALVQVVSKPKSIEVKTKKRTTYSCGECDKVFRTKSQRNVHQESHIPVELRKHVICDICGIKVTCVTNLKCHKQRVHFKASMPKPLECRICGKTFMQMDLARYKSHLNAHTGERPHQCSVCGKGFCRKWSLTLHEKTHNQTLIQCSFCPNWYKSDKYLRRHLAKHHRDLLPPKPPRPNQATSSESRVDFIGPKLMYPCEPCKKVFVYKSMLVAHLKHKHKWDLGKSENYPNQVNID